MTLSPPVTFSYRLDYARAHRRRARQLHLEGDVDQAMNQIFTALGIYDAALCDVAERAGVPQEPPQDPDEMDRRIELDVTQTWKHVQSHRAGDV